MINFLNILLIVVFFSIGLFLELKGQHNCDKLLLENELGEIEILGNISNEDGLGEGVIISFNRKDSLIVEEWTKEYIKNTSERLIKKYSEKKGGSKGSLCFNLDFEDGNFTNWVCQVGINNGYPAGNWSGTDPVPNRHEIMSGGIDPYGGFPRVAPGGGNFSARIGNNNVHKQAERIIYTFIVQPYDSILIYKYAVVLQDPGHTPEEQPYFDVLIVDAQGNPIQCGYRHYVAGPNLPGFGTIGNVRYKSWTTQGINLINYVGQVISIIVTSADCSKGGHFGYGYIDFICPSSFTITPQYHTYCETTTSAILQVPNPEYGMAYLWSTGDTTQSIIINPQMYKDSVIKCYIYPPLYPQCGYWYTFHIKILESPSISILPENPVICYGDTSVTLTVEVSGGYPPYSFLWNNGSTSQSITVGPGFYAVWVTDTTGCPPKVASTNVVVAPAPITANAGPDQTLCITDPVINLNGQVSVATGGIWSGGNGTFLPSNSSLNATYYPTFQELQNGTITLYLTTTGNGGCPPAIDTIVINFVDFQGTLETNITNVTCYGYSNGMAIVTVNEGNAPFTYLWNTEPPIMDSIATNLSAGDYKVTVTDKYGCTASASITIQQPLPLSLYVVSVSDVSCYGQSDGFANVSAIGGNPGYSYIWSNNIIGPTISNVSAGTYSVTVIDALGCQTSTQVTINSPPQLNITIQELKDPKCYNENTGYAMISVTGGIPPYNYQWTNNSSTSNIAVGLNAGMYTVTVYDQNQCTSSISFTLQNPSPIQVSIEKTDVKCHGGSDGSAMVNVSGGVPPYTYVWSPYGGNSNIATNLVAGNYIVTVLDYNGCQKVNMITINQPEPLVLNVSKQDVLCYGANTGSASVMVNGGTSPYTYSWSPNVSSSNIAVGLYSGNYYVTVTDANNCTSSVNFFINQPQTPLSINLNKQDVSCYGYSDGTITVSPSGGIPPYSYFWMPGGFTTQHISGLSAGNYYVTVVDANGCSIQQSITITQPDGINLNVSIFHAYCGLNNGRISLNPTGGTPPYFYSWNPSNYSGQEINFLSPGIYSVTVTDMAGCSSVGNFVINDLGGMQVSLLNYKNPSCYGLNDGWIAISVSGGIPPYSYSWYPYGNNNDTIYNLGAGIYSVTVSDAGGCIMGMTMPFALESPPPISIVKFVSEETCYGSMNGMVNIEVLGGTPPYSYYWEPGGYTSQDLIGLGSGIYRVTITDSEGCIYTDEVEVIGPDELSIEVLEVKGPRCRGENNGEIRIGVSGGREPYQYYWSGGVSTSEVANGLEAGVYSVTVVDAGGCSKVISVEISDPMSLEVEVSKEDVKCYGGSDGSAWVEVSGGVSPYYYSWEPVGGNSWKADNLGAGSYIVRVVDSNGCEVVKSVEISQPMMLEVSVNKKDVRCNGEENGEIILGVNGGVMPYTYEWTPMVSNSWIGIGLSAGWYNIRVIDGNGCEREVNVEVIEPAVMEISFNKSDVSCYGGVDGMVEAIVSGGVGPYSYYWMPGGYDSSKIEGLVSGEYSVTVVDSNGCTVGGEVTINQPSKIEINAEVVNSNCGISNGQITLNPTGGFPPYSYQWNPSNYQGAVIGNLLPGVYQVTVTDAVGCTVARSISVGIINGPQATIIDYSNPSCFGSFDGWIAVSVSGGTPPYHYSWFPYGGNNDTAYNLGAGIFSVEILDSNGCKVYASLQEPLTYPKNISVIGFVENVSCYGSSNGKVNLIVSGGTPPYSYYWEPGGYTTQNLIGLDTGYYYVTITDSKGCEETYYVYISQPPPLTATIVSINNVSCNGFKDGSITVSVSGGTPPYTYNWSPSGNTSNTASGLAAGTHTLFVTDSKGCSYSISAHITQPPPIFYNYGFMSPSCISSYDGYAWINVSGGSPPYSYSWSPITSNNDTLYNISSGSYIVTVIDQSSCKVSTVIYVPQPVPLIAEIGSYQNVSCFGSNNGYATVQVTGGHPPYSYNWSNGESTSTIVNLSEGLYIVTVLDSKGCLAVDSIYITEPDSSLTISIVSSNVLCYNSSNGYAMVNVHGGTPPYTYLWLPTAQTTQQVFNLFPGIHTVTVTDANGCTQTGAVTITQPYPLESSTEVLQNVLCYNTPTGIARVNVFGGTPPYSYYWNTIPPQTTNEAKNIYAGKYYVTITDANNCQKIDSVFLPQPDQLIINVKDKNDVTCFGMNNGYIHVEVLGGTPPYSYVWNTQPPLTSSTITNLSAGLYVLTVIDANNCTAISSIIIEEPSEIITYSRPDTSVCIGESVKLYATASGGEPPYTYNWLSFGVINEMYITPTQTSSYVVVAFDSNNCPGKPDTVKIYVKTFNSDQVSMSAVSPICPGSTSMLVLNVDTEPNDVLTFNWSHGLGSAPGPFVVNPTKPTWYYVTVTNSCNIKIVDSTFIDMAPSPIVQIDASSISGCSPLNVTFKDSTIEIFDEIENWTWYINNGPINTGNTLSYTFLNPGIYYVWLEVETHTGCKGSSENTPITIYVFDKPKAFFTTNKEEYTIPNDPVIVTNLSEGAVSYYWDFGDGTISYKTNPVHNYSDFGKYTITLIAMNQHQCLDTFYKTITVTGDLIFPNAFTPNQNGPNGGIYKPEDYSNQVFFPIAKGVIEFKMQIFNRWGELIFETNDINIGWDGYYRNKLCEQGVYVYKAWAKFKDGKEIEKIGDVLLIR